MKKLLLLAILFLSFCIQDSIGQTTVSGTVSDNSDESLIGANVLVDGTSTGTITDVDGNFKLTTNEALPITLVISYTGYSTERVPVTENNQTLNITLDEGGLTISEVVVSAASRKEERILEAPLSIERIGLSELRNTASIDAYGTVNNLKGVTASTGSISFTSVNTRGFADMQNWRFVQLLDGMDASVPTFNYPLGGASGPADIDIASIEIVPGANSALYGANAFNGIMSIKTKSPWLYQGLSAYVKGGVTSQEGVGSNPLFDVGFRYAKNFNDKFAFKVNFGYFTATDWTANDNTFHVNGRIAPGMTSEEITALAATDPNALNFDAVNRYGDEVVASVDLDGDPMTDPTGINRTGLAESDIIDYNIDVLKFDGSIHYKLTDDIEASYGYRYVKADPTLRHTVIYPLVNNSAWFNRLELKGSKWNLRANTINENAGDSYAILRTGSFIEGGLKSNEDWAADYAAAYQGTVSGVNSGDHSAARAHADSDIPGPESPAFQELRNQTLGNADLVSGGSRLPGQSSRFALDGNYDLSNDALDIQVGANYIRAKLDSEGFVFNDGPDGFAAPIPVARWGAYVQLGKEFFDRLKLRGSFRYDGHQDFDAAFTPRLSAVVALDKEKNHNFRASFQTGFRNPSSQEAYIALPLTPGVVLLGGVQNNIDNFNLPAADGSGLINGKDIVANLQWPPGPPAMEKLDIARVKQEKNTSWEIGYKGIINKKLFVDVNYYSTIYDDLVVRLNTFNPFVGKVLLLYTNITDRVTSNGFGATIDYAIGKGFTIGGNYTFTSFDAVEALENTPGFLPSFNTPEHRVNLSFSGNNVGGSDFGFDVKLKSWSDYTWQSPFGVGPVDAASIVDVALTYKLKAAQSQIKVGASNVFNNEYRTIYGGPGIGGLYFISWTYDQMFSK